MAEPLTPEEEWEIINTQTFDTELRTKIQDIRTALAGEEAKPTPPGIETNITGVYVLFYEEGDFLNISVGRTTPQGVPQVSMRVPSVWLEG